MNLYSQSGELLSQRNLQDKVLWCTEGERQEQAFIRMHGKNLGLKMNPEKRHDKYAPDLQHSCGWLAELKTRNTPFFFARTKFNLNPQYVVTVNEKDVDRYTEKYPNLLIYFAVEWLAVRAVIGDTVIEVDPMSGVWGIRFSDMREQCKSAKVHAYKQRVNDTNGNGKGSFVLSLSNFRRLA